MEYLIEILKWLLVVEIIGFLALPFSAYLFNRLPDRGYSVSKIMGLLFMTYFSWILTYSGFTYGLKVIIIALFLLMAISFIFYREYGICIEKRTVLRNELFFVPVFFIFLIIRSYSPDSYWEIGEKFMDMAFINSILVSLSFPPPDPWFSGETMNYYYLGYVLTADLVKLTGTSLNAGFNIASAVYFALSASAAFGIGMALFKKARFAFITFVFVLFSGNLAGSLQLLVIFFFPAYYEKFNVPDADLFTRISTFDQWPGAKIIPGTITEFPYHQYIIGDLHPNLVSISFQLLLLAALLSIIRSGEIKTVQGVMLGLMAGFFFPLNTWEYPTYVVIIIAVVFLTASSIKDSIQASAWIIISSLVFYFPYHLSYQKVHDIAVIVSGRTEIVDFLLIFGVFIFMVSYFLINDNRLTRKESLKWLSVTAILLPLSILMKFQLLVLLIPLTLLAYFKLIKEKVHDKQFIYLLILIGLLLSLFAELFYISDPLSKMAYFRFNTVFKLYNQIWILLGIAASFAFYEIAKKKIVYIALILIFMSLVSPVLITFSQSGSFGIEPSLDAERSIRIDHPYEYQAIEWFRDLENSPVILQAPGYSGLWSSYISTFTGFPTVLGWEWHEYQWRNDLEDINIRRNEVDITYTSENYDMIEEIINKYGIDYVYVGPVERERYSITGIFDKHDEKFKLVFNNRDVKIYKVS